jgi:hypothetical protein
VWQAVALFQYPCRIPVLNKLPIEKIIIHRLIETTISFIAQNFDESLEF